MIQLKFNHYCDNAIPESVTQDLRILLDDIACKQLHMPIIPPAKEITVTLDIQDYWIILEFGPGSDHVILYSSVRNTFDVYGMTLYSGDLMSLSQAINKLESHLLLKQKLYGNTKMFIERVRTLPATLTDEQWKIEYQKINADYTVVPISWKQRPDREN